MKCLIENAFTLIELIIVIAVIGLLAAIGVSSLLSATIRAKICRTASDLRVLNDAILMYTLDSHTFPIPCPLGTCILPTIPYPLTTPIAYLNTFPRELFPNPNREDVTEMNLKYVWCNYVNPKWTIWSNGPDCINHGGIGFFDASNGLNSIGDIVIQRHL